MLWCWIDMQDLGSSGIHPTLLSFRSWWRRRAGRLRTRRKAASRGPLESSAGRRSGIGYISLVLSPSRSCSPLPGYYFKRQQPRRPANVSIENQRAEAERELAEQRAQDEALQAYLNQMSQLMLERKLLEAEQGDPRAYTGTGADLNGNTQIRRRT